MATTINAWVLNISANEGGAVRTSIPVSKRPWCMASSSAKPYGDGKAEFPSEHGRLVSRKFVWTPVTAQGVCEDPVACKYTVKFQAFDQYGTPSVVKTYEISVARSQPAYVTGTIGNSPSPPSPSLAHGRRS